MGYIYTYIYTCKLNVSFAYVDLCVQKRITKMHVQSNNYHSFGFRIFILRTNANEMGNVDQHMCASEKRMVIECADGR